MRKITTYEAIPGNSWHLDNISVRNKTDFDCVIRPQNDFTEVVFIIPKKIKSVLFKTEHKEQE